MKINALVAHDTARPLTRGEITLRALQPQDVKIEIMYCGVCHSDLHMARNEWAASRYPLVPAMRLSAVWWIRDPQWLNLTSVISPA